MKKHLLVALFVLISSGVLVADVNAVSRSAKVTLVVVDEEGTYLEGIDVGVGFEKNKRWGTETIAQRGITGSEGRFTAAGSCNGHIGYGARKKGYYRTHHDYDFNEFNSFGWQPWNPQLKLIMRKIGNPVPLYARKVDGEVPVVGKEVGFDLIIGDWVSPYGKGVVSDLNFFLEKELSNKNYLNSKLSISFRGKFDGIIHLREDLESGSEFKLPRFAPLGEYQEAFTLAVTKEYGKGFSETFKRDDSYIFRVRSEEDKNGDLKKGMYGKILGPIKFAPFRSKTAAIEFKYYLNPDYTRNLEFDPKRNLFGELPPLERVGIK